MYSALLPTRCRTELPLSAEGLDEDRSFQPESAPVAGVPADWSSERPQKAQYATICPQPAVAPSEVGELQTPGQRYEAGNFQVTW